MKFMFLTVDVGEERKINTELLELTGLPEKTGIKLIWQLPRGFDKIQPYGFNEIREINLSNLFFKCF